ncbi:hypothetical protein MKJ04_12125 [Pontibacter sp. E15-1]|uniref:hypothetical protein n=1 Tax=Pontibacter sp. E15-1 TaxID=2919918 RepID=UPI001F5002C5|nr:hypothetical protein [Pontibacter sp. E15-1]MCJ8165589.1 hypothetical protein [Pontibacter sp. E15-1]
MLENIINNMKGQLTGELQSKFNLEPDKADKSVDLAKENLMEEMKQRASSGDFGGIMDVLKGQKGATQSAGINNVIQKYVGDLTAKLGIPESIAKQVAPFVITFIMDKFSSKVASEGMGQSEIVGSLLSGGIKDSVTKGLGGKLGGLFK